MKDFNKLNAGFIYNKNIKYKIFKILKNIKILKY